MDCICTQFLIKSLKTLFIINVCKMSIELIELAEVYLAHMTSFVKLFYSSQNKKHAPR